MKYEITKGSEKDFEGAPESATVRIIESGFEDRFPIFADKLENYSTRTHCATGDYDSYIANVSNWTVIAERRPITEPELKPVYGDGVHDDSDALQQRIDMGIDISNIIGEQGKLFNISKPLQLKTVTEPVVNQQLTTEWDGKSLPPVGTECEIRFMDCWKKIKITGHGAFNILVIIGNSSKEEMIHKDQDFRPIPIRSAEDVARDEGKEIIAESLKSSKDYDEAAARILDSIAAGRIPNITKTPTVSELMRVTEKATREDCEAIVKMMGCAVSAFQIESITVNEMWREFEKKSDMEDVYKLIKKRASQHGSF